MSGFVPLKYSLLWTSAARPTANWQMRLIVFTAGYGLRHSVGLVHAHSLESCVCENGSGSGEKGPGGSPCLSP
jgi:hypothetical protein